VAGGLLFPGDMRLLVAALIASVPALAANAFTGRVIRVADGDTLTIEAANRVVKVRLFGVDAPESGQEDGDAARWFTANAALDRTVTVIERDFDRYGRMVADIVLPDGRALNRELVKAGRARWYPRYAPNEADLQNLETEAREHRRGIWANAQQVAPWEWRKSGRVTSHAASRRSSRRSERRSYR
jgi:micrococcal nuclease